MQHLSSGPMRTSAAKGVDRMDARRKESVESRRQAEPYCASQEWRFLARLCLGPGLARANPTGDGQWDDWVGAGWVVREEGGGGRRRRRMMENGGEEWGEEGEVPVSVRSGPLDVRTVCTVRYCTVPYCAHVGHMYRIIPLLSMFRERLV
jgi:hypothetical protein